MLKGFKRHARLREVFSRIVTTDFYDGPTEGVLEARESAAWYKCEMLSWDDWQDVRIFSLTPINAESFESVICVFAEHDSPRWPLWVPHSQRAENAPLVEKFLQTENAVECIFASEGFDEILEVKILSNQQSMATYLLMKESEASFGEWRKFLCE